MCIYITTHYNYRVINLIKLPVIYFSSWVKKIVFFFSFHYNEMMS